MMQQSLDMYRRTVGPEHPAVARAMSNLGMWEVEAGAYATAELLLRDAVALRRKLLGDKHTDVAASLTLLATLLIDTGRYEEARQVAAEARAICLPALGPDHRRTAAATSAEGAALAGLGHSKDAEAMLLEGLKTLQADEGALPFVVDNATRWTAQYYIRHGNASEGARYLAMLKDRNRS